MEYNLVRTRRKTIALIVDKDARLIVRAPHAASKSYIDNLINEKAEWIEKKIIEISSRKKRVIRNYHHGDELPYLGRMIKLKYIDSGDYTVGLVGDELNVDINSIEHTREIVKFWYRKQALRYFNNRTIELAKQYNFKIRKVKVSTAETKWGSCSSGGNINLSWKLMMAPPIVIDSVIIHELAHTIHLNHSKEFWAIVRGIIPDYDVQSNWLNKNGPGLEL
jgi:predicted metal-dependent hydrolase